ncbi:MAG: class I SAM-dependent methyltransferase [Candidatus Pacebacteria bacterium]|nr:class I SAM-dependent methyltransferase [Candidatus Paceibacterota bacterium]
MKNNIYSWVPTPRYLCRKAASLELLKTIRKGKFLEIGIGAGDFISKLFEMGYCGLGIDLSDEAIDLTKKRIKNINNHIEIKKQDFFEINEKFDIVFAFELMEHFENDKKFLIKINNLLNKSGHFIFSVPARKNMWDINDVWAGHFRRYEKKEIELKLKKCNFEVLQNYSYGFPTVNLIKPIRNSLINKKNIAKKNQPNNTLKSGVDRNYIKKFSSLINEYTMMPSILIQKMFYNFDFGDGYVVLAKKIEKE